MEVIVLNQVRAKRQTARLARTLAVKLKGAHKARALAFAAELEDKANILEDQLVSPFHFQHLGRN